MAKPLTLDQYGNTLVPNPLLKGRLAGHRHVAGTHDMCGGEMTAMPISGTHFVLACDGICRFTMHVPRVVNNVEALRSWCGEQIGARRADAA